MEASVRKVKESCWWVWTPYKRMWLWELLAVGGGKEIFTRKGKKEEATGQIQLVSGPEPPPPGFLIQGKVVGYMEARVHA